MVVGRILPVSCCVNIVSPVTVCSVDKADTCREGLAGTEDTETD